MVDQVRFLTEGFMLGLATGHICMATCGPVYAPFLMSYMRTPVRYITAVLELSLGRFITYILIGAIAGIFGRQVSDLERDYFTIAAYLLFSAFLIISALRSKGCEGKCATSRWDRFSERPILLGILTGINICPSFLLAFSRSFTLSGPVAGMLFFAAFFVGTSIFLIPLSFIGMFGRKKLFRTVARIAAFGVAIWFIGSACYTAYGLLGAHFDPRPIINLLDDKPAYVILDDPEKAQRCAKSLASNRSGKVYVGSANIESETTCYIFTDSTHVRDRSGAPLRKAGRFVIVLGAHVPEHPDSLAAAIEFLRKYHFRFNTDKGNVFFLK
jgi:sulfite exporter TauE/SafE